MTPALDGLKVIDLSPTPVGAQVTQVLADFGADVLWIERPGGSALRDQPAFPFFARGKQSIELDLEQRADRDTLLGLARDADVFVETFRPGVADRLGLGFDRLALDNPRLVYASITGFGRTGPYAAVKGYEALVMAKLGVNAAFRAMTREQRPPFVAAPWCTFSASQTALHGILAALYERERSGLGQHVEANLVQGFAALDTWAWFLHLIADRWPDAYEPVAVFDDDGVPASPFPYMLLNPLTKDGRWLQFAQVRPHLFVALMRALGLEWMLTDPEWAGIPVFEDPERRLGLWERMLEAAGSKTLAEWEAIFDADPDVFAELFRRGPEVLDHPQLVHDGHVVEIEQPGVGPVRQPGPLVQMEGTPAAVDRPAPALGEHQPPWSHAHRSQSAPVVGRDAPDDLPLAGVTVLELAVLYAAPFGATLLADLGARVIKVEPLDGDPIRTIVPFPEAGGAKVMQGKESICIDLSTPEGLALVHELARRSDLVLQGFRAGAAERLGVDAATLRSVNPDLVYLAAPGYGTGPPCGHRPSFAPSIGAAGGIALANIGDTVPEAPGLDLGQVRDGAIRLSGAGAQTSAQADGFAALGVATSLLLGLLARERGAGGQAMVASMLSTIAHAMGAQVVAAPGTSEGATPDDQLRGLGARYRTYDATDGWVFLAAPCEHEWEPLVTALAPYVDLAGDARFATEAERGRNDAELADVLASAFATRGKDDWERELLRADVGCVAVTTESIETTLWSEGFSRAAGYVVDVEHPIFEQHPRLAPLVRFSRSRTRAEAGVLAGSATDAVLRELGHSDAEIADLRERGVIR
jgi:crotonobetainyl-CoA:carnitine CoA-transferase CaiB-like acyl-CoA transferase